MEGKIQCVYHGAIISENNFYLASPNSVYKGIGRIPVCKSCVKKIIDRYYDIYTDTRKAVFFTCRKLDVAFDDTLYEGSLKAQSSNVEPFKVFGVYMRQINSIGSMRSQQTSFDDGEDILIEEKEKEKMIEKQEYMSTSEMTDTDKANKEEVIRLLGHEPFEKYSSKDQKFLYNDLIGYLQFDGVADDPYLLSQIIQIVHNNNEIRNINDAVASYSSNFENMVKNQNVIKSLNKTKKDLTDMNDKIAKSNNISLSSRRAGSQKASLTLLIDELIELDFEEAEVDYYDEKISYGMQLTSDISAKSMMEFLNLDENDTQEIIQEQREMLVSLQRERDDLKEELRRERVKLAKLSSGGDDSAKEKE